MRKYLKYVSFLIFISLNIRYPSVVYAVESANKLENRLENNFDKVMVVNRKQPEFTLRLESNPSTGFSWFLEDLSPEITAIDHNYLASENGLRGAGGFEEWTFRVKYNGFVVPRRLCINLIYVRPWEVSGKKLRFWISTTN